MIYGSTAQSGAADLMARMSNCVESVASWMFAQIWWAPLIQAEWTSCLGTTIIREYRAVYQDLLLPGQLLERLHTQPEQFCSSRKVTVCPPCRRQASSAASASRICFRHHASTVALARDARSHQVQTVHTRVQVTHNNNRIL